MFIGRLRLLIDQGWATLPTHQLRYVLNKIHVNFLEYQLQLTNIKNIHGSQFLVQTYTGIYVFSLMEYIKQRELIQLIQYSSQNGSDVFSFFRKVIYSTYGK